MLLWERIPNRHSRCFAPYHSVSTQTEWQSSGRDTRLLSPSNWSHPSCKIHIHAWKASGNATSMFARFEGLCGNWQRNSGYIVQNVRWRYLAYDVCKWNFCSFDVDLDPMTLVYELDLDILKTYLHIKNELSTSRLSKVRALQTDRQTDTRTDKTVKAIKTPHLRVVKIAKK